MKQLLTVFKFEFSNYIKSKSFLIFSAVICGLLLIASTIPTAVNLFKSDTEESTDKEKKQVQAYWVDSQQLVPLDAVSAAMPNYQWQAVEPKTDAQLESAIQEEEIELAVIINNSLDFKIVSKAFSQGQQAQAHVGELLTYMYKLSEMTSAGISVEHAVEVMNVQPTSELVSLGENYMANFFYAYALVFLLYFALVIYGQFVASAVVTEKTSKAMEILITSAKPLNLMFGKVLGVGAAGLLQFTTIILIGVLGVTLNRPSYEEYDFILDMLTKIDANLIVFTVIFFILGYFLYAFMFAAFASTISKPEEASSASTVPMMMIVVVFMVSMVGLSSPDSTWVVALSFVPFFTPMVMTMRIAMTEVPLWQVLISVAELMVALYFIAYISAKIFRLGVLMYGKTPKLGQILKMLKQA